MRTETPARLPWYSYTNHFSTLLSLKDSRTLRRLSNDIEILCPCQPPVSWQIPPSPHSLHWLTWLSPVRSHKLQQTRLNSKYTAWLLRTLTLHFPSSTYFYFPLNAPQKTDIVIKSMDFQTSGFHQLQDSSVTPANLGFFSYPFLLFIPQHRPGGSTEDYPPRMPCGFLGATWPHQSGWTWGACAASVGPSSAAAQLAPGAHSANTWKQHCTWTGTPDSSR